MCAREGVKESMVAAFMDALWFAHPEDTIISGGADPEFTLVESHWLLQGGRVVSWRTRKVKDEHYEVVRWEGWDGEFRRVWTPPEEPSFADQKSAFHYRDILIAEECDRLVAFFGKWRSRGAGFTYAYATDLGRDTYEYFNREAA